MRDLDKIILGHNQFFGISHLSSERAIVRQQYFSKTENIIDIVKYSYQKGGRGLMLSTHPKARLVAQALKKEKKLAQNLNLYILLPYMAKYVKAANKKGMVKMATDILKQTSWSQRLDIGIKVGLGFLKNEKISQLKALIDLELLPFKKLKIKAVFLHNGLTDLLVGLQIGEIVNFFAEYIQKKHQAYGGFCTLSLGTVFNYFKKLNIEKPLLMASFNPMGFQMNPSKSTSERILKNFPCDMIAMSTLAAGQVKPKKAAAYLRKLKIRSVVVGASNKRHIDETYRLFKQAV